MVSAVISNRMRWIAIIHTCLFLIFKIYKFSEYKSQFYIDSKLQSYYN